MGLDATVCASCGVVAAQARGGRWLHADELPENVEPHDIDTVIDRRSYLFGEQAKAAEARIPQEYSLEFAERQALALESIAQSLRTLVERPRMDT